MTRIKQQIVKALDAVDPNEMLTLYSIVCGFAAVRSEGPVGGRRLQPDLFMRVRRALGGCRGALAEDILDLRDDRV